MLKNLKSVKTILNQITYRPIDSNILNTSLMTSSVWNINKFAMKTFFTIKLKTHDSELSANTNKFMITSKLNFWQNAKYTIVLGENRCVYYKD